MIKLDELDPAIQAEHFESLYLKAIGGLNDPQFRRSATVKRNLWMIDLFDFLADNVVPLLIGDASDILHVAEEIRNGFPQFDAYCESRPKKKSPRRNADFERLICHLEKSFDYNKFSNEKEKWGAYSLVRAHQLRLCPYCQLSHINYHNGHATHGFSMRPPLDHFFPKSRYPFLAVSLSNLVPSCSQCNSSVKRDIDPLAKFVPHPNLLPVSPLKFSMKGIHFASKDAVDAAAIAIEVTGTNQPAKNFVSFFKLAERYSWYGHEIADLCKRHFLFIDHAPVLPSSLREDFVCGFEPSSMDARLLGHCLFQIANELSNTVSP